MKKTTSMMGILGFAALLTLLLSTITPVVSAEGLPHGGVHTVTTYLIGDTIVVIVVYNDGFVEITSYSVPTKVSQSASGAAVGIASR
jgi:hypothetical protein